MIDIDAKTCAELQAAQFADCFSRVSNIRDFKDNPTTQPWIQEVTLQGGTCDTRTCSSPAPIRVVVHLRRQREHRLERLCDRPQGNDFTVSVGGDNLVRAERAERVAERRVDEQRLLEQQRRRPLRPDPLVRACDATAQVRQRQLPDPVAVPRERHERRRAQLVRTSETAPGPAVSSVRRSSRSAPAPA